MKVSLDLHDFSVINNRLDLLLKLKDHFPDFKVSLFTVPIDTKSDWGAFLIRNEILDEIKKHLDWIQIIPHGLAHTGQEMRNCDYQTFKSQILPDIKRAFQKDGLPFVNGFCAPHWKWNTDVIKVLDEEDWWGAIDKNQPDMPSTQKFYRYSHSLDEQFPHLDTLKLHGHLYGTRNDLGKHIDKMMMLPESTQWHFVTDFLEENENF